MTKLLTRPASVIPASVILVGHCAQRLAACVQVRKTAARSQIGMLAVHPESQGRGWGSEMLKRVEKLARTRFRSETAVLTVITRRAELMSFYRARGYQATGETEAYPLSAGVARRNALTSRSRNW